MEHQIVDQIGQAPSDAGIAAAAETLSDEQLAQFQREGFLVVRGLGSPEICRRMRDVAQRDLEAGTGSVEYETDTGYPGAPESLSMPEGRTIRRLLAAHSRDMIFTDWISRPSVVERLRQLLGPSLVMPLAHHNCVMTKQPRFSSETGWHQDIRYWSFARPELVSLWLALGSECEQNGCLSVVPGSHQLELGPERLDERLFLRDDLQENQELLERRIPVLLEPGDALIFHCRMLHAASRNRTDAVKLSVVFTFRPEDNPPIPGTRSASLPEILLPTSARPAAE